MSDFIFTYDTKPFENSMNKMGNTYNTFINKVDKGNKVTETSSKKMEKASFNAGKKLAWLGAKIGVLFMAVKKAVAQIPELGQTFKAAGGIILKNLLYPLRKELVPMLQKLLLWVKDHRTMFVKWGEAIVSVFRIVKRAFMIVLGFAKSIMKGIKDGIQEALGLTINNLLEVFNLIIFKIVALMMLFKAKTSGIGKNLASIFKTLTKEITLFVKAFAKSMNDFDINPFRLLESSLFAIDKLLKAIFKGEGLGSVAGSVIGSMLLGLQGLAETLLTTVVGLANFLEVLNGNQSILQAEKNIQDFFFKQTTLGRSIQESKDNAKYGKTPTITAGDIQNVSEGKSTAPIQYMPNNMPIGTGRNITSENKVVNSTLNLTVSSKDMEELGKRFGKGYEESLKSIEIADLLNNERSRRNDR